VVSDEYLKQKAKQYFGLQAETDGWDVSSYSYQSDCWAIIAHNKGLYVEVERYPRDESEYVAIRFMAYGGEDNEVLFNVSVVGNSPEVSLRKLETIRNEVTEQLSTTAIKVKELFKDRTIYGKT